MQHPEPGRPGGQFVAIGKAVVHLGGRRELLAQEDQPCFLLQGEDREVVAVQVERDPEARAERVGRQDVIEVGVGGHRRHQPQAVRLRPGDDPVGVVARVDHDRLPREGIAHQVAVALEGADNQVVEQREGHPRDLTWGREWAAWGIVGAP